MYFIVTIFQITRAWFKLYRANKDDENSWKIPIASIEKGLRIFEEELVKRNLTFFGGKIATAGTTTSNRLTHCFLFR